MTNKLDIIFRLITGLYTPFLSTFWGEEEWESVKDWLNGANYSDAQALLEQKIVSDLGGQWGAWLFNSGRSAIQFALQAMNLPQNSEVLVPTFSCMGVVMPVIQVGLRPVFVDVDEQFNIRLDSILEADGPHVRAVIVSHLSGCWAKDMDEILKWAKTRGVFVVDDVAQAQGLVRKGNLAGSFGDVGIFSSGLGKMVFGPGGGWLISRNPEISKALSLCKHPLEPRERVAQRIKQFVARYTLSGGSQGRGLLKNVLVTRMTKNIFRTNTTDAGLDDYRFSVATMSDIEARLALLQMQKIELIIKRRRMFAARWRSKLDGLGLATLRMLPEQDNIFSKMLLAFDGNGCEHESRMLKETLWDHGVEVEPSYIPLHTRQPFKEFRQTSMKIVERPFSVPVRPNSGCARLGTN